MTESQSTKSKPKEECREILKRNRANPGSFLAVSVIQALAGALVALLLPHKVMLPLAPHFTQWLLLSNAITVAALSVPALRTEWRDWALGAALAALPLAITLVDGIEGVYFLPHSPIDWTSIFAQSTLSALLSVPIWVLLFGRRVAPLLTPNPYFPYIVRWAHFCETGSSNFVFAALVAWLWGQPKLIHAKGLAHAA
jgi:hypothetical protein